jgi:hypothetical protein
MQGVSESAIEQLRSQLRIYWCYFTLSSQHVSAPSGHLQVKYHYTTYISRESNRYYNGKKETTLLKATHWNVAGILDLIYIIE